MLECDCETEDISVLVSRLEQILSGWTVDCVFDFGSNAKDEAVSHSDVDIWFLVHSDHKVLLDKSYEKHIRYRSTRDTFLCDYKNLDVVEVDTWGTIVKALYPVMVSCPVADTRWFLWQLANESDWQTFLYMTFARVLYDPFDFIKSLQTFLWSCLPFHIHPDHGIVWTLTQLCETEKYSLIGDLREIQTQDAIELSQKERPGWLRYAVECIRDPISLLTLVQDGRPLFRRQDVLQYIEIHFKERMALAQKVYEYKCTQEGRTAFDLLLTERCSRDLDCIAELTFGLIEFWHEIILRVESTIVAGRSPLRFRDTGWREENMRSYGEFFKSYLRRVT
jgi:predicted nucleotidyltransferase